jgi:Protein of unknown function (DUF3060)
MKPEDDPEARIRELERPLAETARASEMGSNQTPGPYPYQPGTPGPPPMPPVNYGTNYGPSFPPTAPRSFSFSRTWWIFIVAFVLFPMIITGFIAFSTSRQASHNGITTFVPTPSLSPSAAPNSPSSSVTQAPTASASATSLPPAGGELTLSGIKESRTVACNQSAINLSGISNKIAITGHCTRLHVSGVQNTITVDAVDSIDVSGFNNQITYHTGSPSIDKSGDGNVVQQG